MIKLLNSWLSKHSLKFKLNISILTCICIGFLSLDVLISKKVEPIIKSQIDTLAQRSIESYAADFTHFIIDAERVVLNTKNTLNQTDENNLETIRLVLNSAIKTVYHTDLNFTNAWLYIFPPEDVSTGKLYISTDTNDDGEIDFKTEEISNFYDRFPWFNEVPKEEEIYWSEPYIDKISNLVVSSVLIPFKFKERQDFNALVALTIDLSDIQSSFNNFTFYETGKLLLISRTGLYVTHPNPNIALKMSIFDVAERMHSEEIAALGKKLVHGETGQSHIKQSSMFVGEAIYFFAPIKHIGWGLCLVYAQTEHLKPIKQFQFIFIGSLLICILLLLIIINWISSKSTKQLNTLSNIASKYGKGYFSERFDDIPTSIDIKHLSEAINSMRINLLDYIKKEKQNAILKQKRLSELEIARHIQESVLSDDYPQSEAFQIATMMIPARQVGGDFYDFFFIEENKFAIVVADVSGKGIPASLYMMKALTLIRNISKSKKGLDFVFSEVNKQLCEGNDSCMFVTAFMAVVDLLSGQTKFLNAGHTPPLIKTNDGAHFFTPQNNIVLGINKKAEFTEEEMTLAPKTHLFLYTDGVTEAENNKSKFYGADRLLKAYQNAKGEPMAHLNTILKDIKKFVKNTPQSDDITMLDFAFHGYAPGTITISADITKLGEILSYLKNDMQQKHLSQKAQFNMITASEEIFSNIALYAYNTNDNAVVTIKTELTDNLYSITFSDTGKKYNPLKNSMPNIFAQMKDKDIGGLGVFLAKKLTDNQKYTYRNKQNILKISININKS